MFQYKSFFHFPDSFNFSLNVEELKFSTSNNLTQISIAYKSNSSKYSKVTQPLIHGCKNNLQTTPSPITRPLYKCESNLRRLFYLHWRVLVRSIVERNEDNKFMLLSLKIYANWSFVFIPSNEYKHTHTHIQSLSFVG